MKTSIGADNAWDFVCSALQGASYYKLPHFAQWFTGNIGFHHIHHLSPRIPNYFLEKCFNETPEFQDAEIITLRASLRSLPLRLWDEQSRKPGQLCGHPQDCCGCPVRFLSAPRLKHRKLK